MARPTSLRSLAEGVKTSINMMVYAYPGVGKTPFWGTGGKELVLMDSDHGTESAIATGSQSDSVSVYDYAALDEVYDYLRHDEHGYRWVSWDSLTLFMDRSLIDDITADAHAANPKTQSPWVPSRREYMIQQSRVSEAIRKFCGLPIHFGVSCHVTTDADNEGTLMYVPLIPGQKGELSTKIRGYMNVVGYLSTTPRGTLRMLTRTSNNYFARDRFGALHTNTAKGLRYHIDNPTVPMLEQMIKEKLVGQDRTQGRQRRRRAS